MNKFKIKKLQILCVAAGVILYLIAELISTEEILVSDEREIRRSLHGQGDTEYELLIDGLDQKEVTVPIYVRERQYSEKEANNIFNKIMPSLMEQIIGTNMSLTEIRSDLNLVTKLEEFGIRVRWETEDPELIDIFGTVYNDDVPDSGIESSLHAILTDGSHEENYTIKIRILPPLLSDKEEVVLGFQKMVDQLDQSQQKTDTLILPEKYNGTILHYRTKNSTDNKILLVLGVILAVLCYAKEQTDVKRKEEHRRQQMLLDYSEIVSKLMVFIGAGMTIRLAWERITLDYEKALESGRRAHRYAYDEMCLTYYQIKSGTSEGKAYGAFGKRCGLQQYLKLSSLLEQNRKTGTKNLRMLLQAEAALAFEQRKNLAKKLGEETGTKLLLPLFLMLGIVMTMIVVPAFLSIN